MPVGPEVGDGVEGEPAAAHPEAIEQGPGGRAQPAPTKWTAETTPPPRRRPVSITSRPSASWLGQERQADTAPCGELKRQRQAVEVAAEQYAERRGAGRGNVLLKQDQGNDPVQRS